MTIDVYQPCPCGSGKKIKFCCCRDITADLGKVVQKLDADQRVAALDQVSKAIGQHGNRAALLAIKAIAQLQLGNEEGAAETVSTFLAEHPQNSVALALSATVKSSEEDPRSGIEPLQRALEQLDETVPAALYESIGALAEALLVSGHVMAARAHYLLQAGFSSSEDEEVNKVLAEITQSPQIPLLLKQTPQLDECPADLPRKADFETALDLAGKGTWLAAAEKFAQLLQDTPDEPALHRNLGVLYCCLGRNDEAAAELRRYAQGNGQIAWDDKVEAEALAQLLSPGGGEQRIPVMTVKYPVQDVDALLERFTDNPHIDRIPVDLSKLGGEDSPPPRGAFWLLDRAVPAASGDLQRQDIPRVLGELFLFGRETDREARLEAVLSQTDDFEQKKQALHEVAGELLGESTEAEQVGEILALEAALTWNWRMPHDVPADRRDQLTAEQRRETILNRWPETPLSVLGGKRPQEVKDDPEFRVRLSAAVWLLEMSGNTQLWDVDYNELRSQLGVPCPEPIVPTDEEIAALPLVRLSRLDVPKLTDAQLAFAFQRATGFQIPDATRAMARELLTRESLADKIPAAYLYGMLVRTAQSTGTALDMVHRAQQAARDAKESPAPYLISELQLRLRRGEVGEFQRLMSELQARHMREPGVAQAVTQIMLNYGIISPEDVNAAARAQAAAGPRLRRRPGAGRAGASGIGAGALPHAGPTLPAAGPAAPAESGLWTPDMPGPKSSPGEEKPKIWMPGMD